MKRNILILLFMCSSASISAQKNDDFEQFKKQAQQEYTSFRDQSVKEFNDFRDQANAEYAEFMRQAWESFQSFQGIPVPKEPKPVIPPIVEPDPKRIPTVDPIPFKEIKPLPVAPVAPPRPIAPIPPSPRPTPAQPQFAFSFYNTDGKVNLDASHRFLLRDVTENSVADAWKTLSDSRYNDLLNDCLTLREELNLCDWGYMELLKTLSEKFFGKPCNEAVLMQMFILSQSGYKVRIARFDERLALLVPFAQTMYQYSYIPVDGLKYYIPDKSLKGKQFYMLNHEFPKEQQASLRLAQPHFNIAATPAKTFASKHYPSLNVRISTNKNLIDFYNNYPINSEWNLYALASLSETVKADLYPALQQQITGKSETEAATILINFVQTAFNYQTDDEQFGYERSLFGDETFFYPASDCEDRAILYSLLVRELMGLEVVLLYYPGHLASAVHFTENVQGDYLIINETKFLVCDPTYIGANIGRAMGKFKNVPATVIKL